MRIRWWPPMTLLAAFLVLAVLQDTLLLAEQAAVPNSSCAAATPAPNPWTKGLPEGWWLKRHEENLASPARKDARIAFLGDSITDGWDAEGGGIKIWEQEYVPMKVLNLGIVCDSTQHVLWRILNGEVDNLPNIKVFVLEIGVNNKGLNGHSEKDIESGIMAICDALKQKAPLAKIVVMGVFPRYFGKDNSEMLNRSLARRADGRQVFFFNINDKLGETEGAVADAVGHLTPLGYQIWADSLRPALKQLMEQDFRPPLAGATLPDLTLEETNETSGVAPLAKNLSRAATPMMNATAPRWYRKNFDIIVWGGKFIRRKAEIAFLGSTATYNWPKALWDKEYEPLKAYNLGMPGDCTEHVLWRIDNAAVDGMSKLKLLVIEAGNENRGIHDKPEDIAAGIEAILQKVKKKLPQTKILLTSIFPTSEADKNAEDTNTLISRLADGKQVIFLNINSTLLKTPGTLGKDRNGLTEKGYEIWADAMRPVIKDVMQKPLSNAKTLQN